MIPHFDCRSVILMLSLPLCLCAGRGFADPPEAKGIFPAGGRRGTTVPVRVIGCNFHDKATFHLIGPDIEANSQILPTQTIWFEGPVIPQPASQAKEEYPQDYANQIAVSPSATLGTRLWQVSTSQGVTASFPFVIGDLPEIVEHEILGDALAVSVPVPITINGRIFPREDVDRWSFKVEAGQTVTCFVDALRLGSPLEARLILRDSAGRQLVEGLSIPGDEALVRFTAQETGIYTAEIQDVQCGGLQNYIYRLTVTNGPHIDSIYPLGGRRGTTLTVETTGVNLNSSKLTAKLPEGSESAFELQAQSATGIPSNGKTLEVSDFEEALEGSESSTSRSPIPGVWNGRISQAGQIDRWTFQARKGEELDFDLRAARLGSPLDSILRIVDGTGKMVAENDDLANGQTDSRLRFTVPIDGSYQVEVRDQLADRGGPQFGYRLHVTNASSPQFQVSIPADSITLERGKTVNVKVSLDRGPGFQDEVTLLLNGLPDGVTAQPIVIGKQQREINIAFQAKPTTKIQCVPVTIVAQAMVQGKMVQQPVKVSNSPSALATTPFWVAVAIPTPFKFQGIFETKFMPRGSCYVRHYAIERNGYTGPLQARLADQQGRHLQGVKGDVVAISPAQEQFDFTVRLPSWMEIGRTSRTTLMLLGKVVDHDGSEHVVSYSSNAQNDQMIALVDPERMSLSLGKRSLLSVPGGEVKVAFRLQKSRGLTLPTRVEIVPPEGMTGVSAEPVLVPPTQDHGEITLKFDANQAGPYLAPLTIRASSVDERNLPVVCDMTVELVAPANLSN